MAEDATKTPKGKDDTPSYLAVRAEVTSALNGVQEKVKSLEAAPGQDGAGEGRDLRGE